MIQEKALTWNLGFNSSLARATANSRRSLVLTLVTEVRPSLIAFQEAPSELKIPKYELERGPGRLLTGFDRAVWQQTERVEFATRAIGIGLTHLRTGTNLFLWNLHLPSMLNGNSIASMQATIRGQLKPQLENARKPGRAELLVGDFNLPPYDQVIMQRDGLWANRSLVVASYYRRKAVIPNLPLFNPTWVLFGDSSSPCGTYHLAQRLDGEGPWHVIDQALMSPNLAIPAHRHVELISRIGSTDLCKGTELRIPNDAVGSDHLPLTIDFVMGR